MPDQVQALLTDRYANIHLFNKSKVYSNSYSEPAPCCIGFYVVKFYPRYKREGQDDLNHFLPICPMHPSHNHHFVQVGAGKITIKD